MTEQSSSTSKTNRIVSNVFYKLDVDENKLELVPLPKASSDFDAYLGSLLSEISKKSQKRSYVFQRETTEFYLALSDYFNQTDLVINSHAKSLSKRLLAEEIKAITKYGHLGAEGEGHVKRGSFLQFLYREGAEVFYLGVKVDHQDFLDETDFNKKAGLSLAKKLYKACKVGFDSEGIPLQIKVFDTNQTPAVYWWQEFLELKVLRDDSENTEKASNAVISAIDRLKKKHPVDHTILRNSVIASFKRTTIMNYDDFINDTVANYVPEDNNLKIVDLVKKLKELPDKKGFDSQFNLVASQVKFRQSKIKLSNEITLTLDDGIDHLDNKIWSEETKDGKKLVVIESAEGFKRFKQKQRD